MLRVLLFVLITQLSSSFKILYLRDKKTSVTQDIQLINNQQQWGRQELSFSGSSSASLAGLASGHYDVNFNAISGVKFKTPCVILFNVTCGEITSQFNFEIPESINSENMISDQQYSMNINLKHCDSVDPIMIEWRLSKSARILAKALNQNWISRMRVYVNAYVIELKGLEFLRNEMKTQW